MSRGHEGSSSVSTRPPTMRADPPKQRQAEEVRWERAGLLAHLLALQVELVGDVGQHELSGLAHHGGLALGGACTKRKDAMEEGLQGGGGGGGGGGGERQRERTCSGLAGSCGQARAWSTACPSTPGAPSMPCTATPPPTRPPTHRGSRRPCCRCPPTPARPSGGSPRLQPARGRARRSDFGGAGCAVLCCEKAARVFTDTARQCFIRLAASLPRSPTQPALHSTAAARAQVHEAHRGWWR